MIPSLKTKLKAGRSRLFVVLWLWKQPLFISMFNSCKLHVTLKVSVWQKSILNVKSLRNIYISRFRTRIPSKHTINLDNLFFFPQNIIIIILNLIFNYGKKKKKKRGGGWSKTPTRASGARAVGRWQSNTPPFLPPPLFLTPTPIPLTQRKCKVSYDSHYHECNICHVSTKGWTWWATTEGIGIEIIYSAHK